MKHRTTAPRQSSDGQLYCLDIEWACLISNRNFQSAFISLQLGVFQGPSSYPCYFFGFATYLEAYFVDGLASWLFASHTSNAHRAFMNVVELRAGTVIDYTNDIVARDHRYKHTVAILLTLAINIEFLCILMADFSIATWGPLRLSRICSNTKLHVPLNAFENIYPAAFAFFLCIRCDTSIKQFKIALMVRVAIYSVTSST